MGYNVEHYYRGVGCKRCRNTGYSGRIGIHELLAIDDEMRDAIVANPSIMRIRELANARGMVTLRYDGFRKVREGITTVEELLHVVGESRDTAEPVVGGVA
jgi:type IV pilus assembly protein PilB